MGAAAAGLLQVDGVGLLVSPWRCRRGVLTFPAIALAGSFSLEGEKKHSLNEYKQE